MEREVKILAVAVYAVLSLGAGCRGAEKDPMERTLDAVRMVESGGHTEVVGDSGRAIGPLQMWKIRVDDCNRIVGYKKWAYDDRLSLEKSSDMFRTSCRHYWPKGGPEQWARHWNGHPRKGPTSRSTLKYWQKCKKVLDKPNG
jgi:hypothetical protein